MTPLMAIDKNWTKLANRDCPEYFTGLDAFLETCKDHLSTSNTCRCPCEKCDNNLYAPLATLRAHIHEHGFSSTYTTWRFHGEQFIPPAAHDNLRQTTDELHDLLDDVRHDEPTEHNKDTNKPTEGPSNPGDKAGELNKVTAPKPHPDCRMTTPEFLAKLNHIKVTHKWTDSSVDQLLDYLNVVLPDANFP